MTDRYRTEGDYIVLIGELAAESDADQRVIFMGNLYCCHWQLLQAMPQEQVAFLGRCHHPVLHD
jgi:hypothetical protein